MKIHERTMRRFGQFFPQDTVIFHEGEEKSNKLYIILSGKVRVEKKSGKKCKTLGILEAGSYFGEVSALISGARTATVKTAEDSHIAVIDSDTFQGLLRNSPEVALMMLQEFCYRLTSNSTAIEDMTKTHNRMKAIFFLSQEWTNKKNMDVEELFTKYCHLACDDMKETLNWLEEQQVIKIKSNQILHFDQKNAREIIKQL